jgi:hypothetical protein
MTKSEKKGFYYTVTEEQVREHQKRSIEEILTWLHETNVFLNRFKHLKRKKE